jgi:hypothetical protein
MALRTRVFATILSRISTPVEEAEDFPALRQDRLRLQGTRVGRAVFGRPDPDVVTEHVVLGTGQRWCTVPPARSGRCRAS